jgi:integrase
MSVYKRGGVWWYEFSFANSRIRESAKTKSKTVARKARDARRRELEDGFNGIKKSRRALLFSVAAEEWLRAKTAHLSPRTVRIERTNLGHLNPFLGKLLLCDISPDSRAHYQAARTDEGASPKTVNLEIGTLRAVLRKHRLWAAIQPDMRMLPTADDVGRAISREEERPLLAACRESRSRSLLPAVTLALNTAMRYSELRLLKWGNINFAARSLTVGKSKTEAGTGRVIPLNASAFAVLSFWAALFPDRKPDQYVFPTERYGAAGDDFQPCAYATDPDKPIGRWKEAWEAAKERTRHYCPACKTGALVDAMVDGNVGYLFKDCRSAIGELAGGVQCRFHDLRHTACTRMLEAGESFPVVASVMGWSASTAVRMAKRYGHIGEEAQRRAVAALSGVDFEASYPQIPPTVCDYIDGESR